MNTRLRRAAAALTVAGHVATDRLARDDRGQGSIEYVGIVVIVGVIVGLVAGVASGLGGTLVTKITNVVNSIGT